MNTATNPVRLPYILSDDATLTTGGQPLTVYKLAFANEGGAYRVTSRRLHDGRWALSANGCAEAFFPREPSAATVCAWFVSAPTRPGAPVIDLFPTRR